MKRLLPRSTTLLLSACDKGKSTAPEESRQAAYESAIEDAVFVDSAEICRSLVAIVPENPGTVWSDRRSRACCDMDKGIRPASCGGHDHDELGRSLGDRLPGDSR